MDKLRQLAAPLAQHATISARFDRQLFQTRSTLMQSCLDEAAANLAALRRAVEGNHLDQVVWLAERLTAQIAALTRESAVWPHRPAPRIRIGACGRRRATRTPGSRWPVN